MLPFEARTYMGIAGVIEIVAGILVFLRPRISAFVVMGCLSDNWINIAN